MNPYQRFLVVSAALGLVGSVTPAGAQSVRQAVPVHAVAEMTQASTIQFGRIDGFVTDERGRPLAGASVSAEGTALSFATSDPHGQFAFKRLAPGVYRIRARLSGFSQSRRELVVVRQAYSTIPVLRLERVATSSDETKDASEAPAVLLAGVGAPPPSEQPGAGVDAPASEDEVPSLPSDAASTAWRLRHLRRSVLRETTVPIEELLNGQSREPAHDPGTLFGRAVESTARLASGLFDGLPLSGQVKLLTTGAFDSPLDLLTGQAASHGVAYIALEAPSGDWAVHTAMTQGDVSSWIVAGSYRLEPTGTAFGYHHVELGSTYATQRYDGGNPAALVSVSDGRRNAGSVSAVDTWAIDAQTEISYGARYARYDYLEQSNLFSPTLSFAMSPMKSTWVRATVAQYMIAPGAEEFAPSPIVGVWLPPERTFSAVGGTGVLRPERARQFDLTVERELGSFVLGVRRFRQTVNDQMVTLFGNVDADRPRSDIGHYFVYNGGSADVNGWAVTVARPVGSRVRGSVEYTLMRGELPDLSSGKPLRVDNLSSSRLSTGRIHDVTGTVETHIPETATRISAVYKLNTSYAAAVGTTLMSGTDGRFELEVNQGLPIGLRNAEWELLVAVSNIFHDRDSVGSMYDELLVVRPPKRVVGGLSVRF